VADTKPASVEDLPAFVNPFAEDLPAFVNPFAEDLPAFVNPFAEPGVAEAIERLEAEAAAFEAEVAAVKPDVAVVEPDVAVEREKPARRSLYRNVPIRTPEDRAPVSPEVIPTEDLPAFVNPFAEAVGGVEEEPRGFVTNARRGTGSAIGQIATLPDTLDVQFDASLVAVRLSTQGLR